MKSELKSLQLTEKEMKIISFLNNFKGPVSINKLQTEVWGYKSKLETHTVETHIHRLRKKIKEKFFDEESISREELTIIEELISLAQRSL